MTGRSLLSDTEARERTIRKQIIDGTYAEAQSSAENLLRSVEQRAGAEASDALALAVDVLVEARWRNGVASPDTLSRAERAVEWHRTHANSPRVADSLRNLGQVLLLAGRTGDAITRFEESLRVSEEIPDQSRSRVGQALDALASGFIQVARYDEAERALQRALEIRQATKNDVSSDLARTLELTGLVHMRAGRYPQSRALFERALTLRRAQPRHADTATTFGLWGDQLWLDGKYVEAREAYQQCVSIAQSVLRESHPDIANCTRRLGNTLASLGDITGALAYFERAASMAETSLGSTHPAFAGYLNDLANAYYALSDFRTSRELYERALAVRERQLGPDHQDVATILRNLALVSSGLGDLREAERQYRRAINIWRTRLGADHPYVANAMTGLARVLQQDGHIEEALSLQREVLQIRERSLSPNHFNTAETLTDLGTMLLLQGRTGEAARVSERALAMWKSASSPASGPWAGILLFRGDVLAATGERRGARENYARALSIREGIGGADHPSSVEARVRLASVAAESGQYAAALEESLAAEDASRRFLLLTLRYLPEREALSYTLKRPTGLNLALSLTASGHTSSTALASSFDSVIRSRAVVFDEIASRRKAIGNPNEPQLSAAWTAWIAARQRLANLTVRADQSQSPRQIALRDETRREAERAERTIAEQSATFRAEQSRPVIGLADVKAALPNRSALVAFVRYDRTVDIKSTVRRSKQPLASYLAFVLGPDAAQLVVVPLGSAVPIDRAIGEWKNDVTRGLTKSLPANVAEREFRVRGTRLRERVWDPIARYVTGSNRVFVVPDGALNVVNLAALPVGTSEYLVDRAPAIHYLTAERDLVHATPPVSTAKGLLVLGGATFDQPGASASIASDDARPAALLRSNCGSFQSMNFRTLPGTLGEVEDVVQRWKTDENQLTPGVQLLSGSSATERAFKSQAPGHRVLHLATHGFFLGGDCESTAADTRGVGGLTTMAASPASLASASSPLLQSGLALAGANRRSEAKPNEDDGILTAEEVASLNLDGVEWAVLSACDTGLGEIKAGEGVFGLRRAFQIAGARTVIMSLWPVEDESTREWMRALYEARLHRRLDTAASVRVASLLMLQARRANGQSTHPFYWAAFVAAGDWR